MVEEDQAKLINDTKKNGGRVISVGPTSCRTLESATDENGILHAGSGWTEIFIYPGYKFKMIDGLITNFHLPESTLLMLVSALAGKEYIMAAYEEAVKESIKRGICKVNFATELRIAYTDGVKELLEEKPETIDPKKYGVVGIEKVKELVKNRMMMCGCQNQA